MSLSSLCVICLSIEHCWMLNIKMYNTAKAPGELTSNQSRLSNKKLDTGDKTDTGAEINPIVQQCKTRPKVVLYERH